MSMRADDGLQGGDLEEERSERQMEARFDNERKRADGQIAPNKKTFSDPTERAISIEGIPDNMTLWH